MQPMTEVGMNHSGIQSADDGGEKMLENTKLTRPKGGDERDLAKIRLEYAKDADPVGSIVFLRTSRGPLIAFGSRLAPVRSYSTDLDRV